MDVPAPVDTNELPPDGVVTIENLIGSVTVEGWNKNQVSVTGMLGEGPEELASEDTRIIQLAAQRYAPKGFVPVAYMCVDEEEEDKIIGGPRTKATPGNQHYHGTPLRRLFWTYPVDHYGEGDIIGGLGILTGEPRRAHVEADTDMDLWVMTRDQFDEMTEKDPALLDFITELVADRFDSRRPTGYRTIGKYVTTDIIGRGAFSRTCLKRLQVCSPACPTTRRETSLARPTPAPATAALAGCDLPRVVVLDAFAELFLVIDKENSGRCFHKGKGSEKLGLREDD